ncbi:ABC transporter permease [Chloroflexi bacterium TSY]|nr:ABC transporter permease [Chloroflexi bacterium TSY]
MTVLSDSLDTRQAARPRNLWSDAARTFARNRAGMLGFGIAVILLIAAIFAPLIAPYDYVEQDWDHINEPPSATHLLGTDQLGRDMLSRILMGLRTAFLVALILTFISTAVGAIVGSLATLIGGWMDQTLVWIMDALMNFPIIWLAAFISITTRPTITRLAETLFEATGWTALEDTVLLDYLVVFTCLALVSWPGVGRLVRGQVLSLREKEFIEAQRAIGANVWWITVKGLVPNVMGPLIVHMSATFSGAMLAESSLSFLGIGIRPPGASLGNMIASTIKLWRSDPHLVLMPGIVLSLAALAFNLMGDALNDALNPRARQR